MLLYHSEIFEKHDTGSHPECIARISKVTSMLQRNGWLERCTKPNWMAATIEQCKPNHTPMYLDQLHRWCQQGAGRVESDTVVSTGSWDAATLAAGAACDAVRRVCNGQDTQAFCAVRPPGHHALPEALWVFVCSTCAHSTTTPGRRREALAEPIPGYLRPALRRARLVTLASARAARFSARYTRTASGWDSFQTSGRSA